MAQPLKVGLAGLGTVGGAVLRQLERGRDKLMARCGRGIEVVAISARSRSKKRGFDIGKLRWISDPAALARDPTIDVLVEVIGGAGGPAKLAVETALAAGKPSSPPTRRYSPRMANGLPRWRNVTALRLISKQSVAGGIPIVKTLREGLNGATFHAHLRHPQRHLQLHSYPHGTGPAAALPMC